MPRGLNYKADLLDDLRNDLAFAAEYLSAAYADSHEAFLVALRDITEAQKGMSQVAHEADINRENLYRMLSKEGNPRLTSLRPVLGTLGIGVQFTALGQASADGRVPIATIRGSAELGHQSTTGDCITTTVASSERESYFMYSGLPAGTHSGWFSPDDVPLLLVAQENTSDRTQLEKD